MDNVNILRERISEAIGLDQDSGHDVISAEIMRIQDQDLNELEASYQIECAEFFGLKNNNWKNIIDGYLAVIKHELSEKSDNIKRQFIINEMRRFQIAKLLQLNKFLASEEEIYFKLDQLEL